MPKARNQPTMTWEEAPDVIGVEELMKILGIGKNYSSIIFNKKDFPKIDGIGTSLKADKQVARMYIQGFSIKQNPKLCIEQMILLELRKLNNNFEERRMNFNEQKAI